MKNHKAPQLEEEILFTARGTLLVVLKNNYEMPKDKKIIQSYQKADSKHVENSVMKRIRTIDGMKYPDIAEKSREACLL